MTSVEGRGKGGNVNELFWSYVNKTITTIEPNGYFCNINVKEVINLLF